MEGSECVYQLKDAKTLPDPIFEYTSCLQGIPLIIDNGSYKCRAGWATDSQPRLVYKNCYAKQRKDRGRKTTETELLVASDISNIEAVRFQLKSPHDENVVTHFEGQELMFDYLFTHLGINTTCVDHPLILTESLCNPNYSRQCMSELLFECYRVPKISYCVDNLLSFHRNSQANPSGLVVGVGNYTTHIMPILDGWCDFANCRRIRMGGHHLSKYLCRWLQLRFPQHLNALTLSRAEEIIREHVSISEDYSADINKWMDSTYCEQHTKRIQLPYTAQPVSTLTAEQQREKKREAAKRLVELNAKKREEKLQEDESELECLIELQQAMEEFTPDEPEFQHGLEEAHVSSYTELEKKIAQLRQRIEKTKIKLSQASSAGSLPEDDTEEIKAKASSSFPCPPCNGDTEEWVEEMKQKWRDIQTRRTARRQRRQEMAKRRTAASQERMRIISQLAKREKKEDNFGMRDEDWDVYKAINKEGGGSDSEEEDEQLQELATILRQYCPDFLGEGLDSSRPMSIAEKYQLLLSSEQIRIGELLFQPSMYGLEQGGISNTIEYVLKLYDAERQNLLANNVLVTGGPAVFPGLKMRLEKDLLAMRPFQSTFRVKMAENPELDAWLSAKENADYLVSHGITKQDYEEMGGDFVLHHKFGNRYWAAQVIPDLNLTSSETKDDSPVCAYEEPIDV